ncbi:MAG: hypothetical protein PVF73_07005 [Bacteroidales bacterium]|jgi:hypothetical protein
MKRRVVNPEAKESDKKLLNELTINDMMMIRGGGKIQDDDSPFV